MTASSMFHVKMFQPLKICQWIWIAKLKIVLLHKKYDKYQFIENIKTITSAWNSIVAATPESIISFSTWKRYHKL